MTTAQKPTTNNNYLVSVINTQSNPLITTDLPNATTEEQNEFWDKLQPVNRPAATDTYKRTMACSGDTFNKKASYSLAARRPLNEEGAKGRLIMAGLERLLYSRFKNPISEKEVQRAKKRFQTTAVKAFPEQIWNEVLNNDGYLPIDIYGFPGGQTFLVKAKDGETIPMHVPLLSIEGPGALVSHLEPHMEQSYAPIIQATKARLMLEATGKNFAEFGYRAGRNDLDHIVLLFALKVGANYTLTSNDEAVYLFPNEFVPIGTVGHEYIMSYQRKGKTLEETQEEAVRDFIKHNDRSAILPDLINTVESGLPLILKLIKEYEGSGKIIMPRFDSGDIKEQVLVWKHMCLDAGITNSPMVVEDGFTPQKAAEIKSWYKNHGFDPEEIIVGAGGYFQDKTTRDAISLAYKRTSTKHDGIDESSIKFSDEPGKFSLPGPIRVYERGSTLIVALKQEKIDGKPLYVPLVKNGRIVYQETTDEQAARAERTWNCYDTIEYSPGIQEIIEERTNERNNINQRFRGETK